MRSGRRFLPLQAALSLLVILTVPACGDRDTVAPEWPATIVPATAEVGLGKSVRFTVRGVPPRVTWQLTGGPGNGLISAAGRYQAPYFVPGTPTLGVEAQTLVGLLAATVTILDVPPSPRDCLARTQSDVPGLAMDVKLDHPPQATVRVAPVYPDIAREAGVDGTVSVTALVCASGLVYDTRVTRSIPMLDRAAIDAVRQWVFNPATQGGRPVAAWVEIPVRFTLH
jgi:TonB family protein